MGTTITFFQSEGTALVTQIFWNHMCIEVFASFPACFKNSVCTWSSPGAFLFFSSFIASWSSQSLIGKSKLSSVAVGFALPILFKGFILSFNYLWFSPSVRHVPFCAREKVHGNVLAISLWLAITVIGTLLLQEVLFWILLDTFRFSGCLSGN